MESELFADLGLVAFADMEFWEGEVGDNSLHGEL